MKVIVLADDDEIEGVFRVAGEVVTVADDYTNVRRVIADRIEQRNEEETKRNEEETKRKREKKKKDRDAKQDKDGNKGGNGNGGSSNNNGTGVAGRTSAGDRR